jgi:hypothetical protein
VCGASLSAVAASEVGRGGVDPLHI